MFSPMTLVDLLNTIEGADINRELFAIRNVGQSHDYRYYAPIYVMLKLVLDVLDESKSSRTLQNVYQFLIEDMDTSVHKDSVEKSFLNLHRSELISFRMALLAIILQLSSNQGVTATQY